MYLNIVVIINIKEIDYRMNTLGYIKINNIVYLVK